MPKKKKSSRRFTNPDFRARSQVPAPPVENIVQRLRAMLTPAAFAPLRISGGSDPVKRRDRLLTLPVMTAIIVSLILRQIPSLTELLRVLAQEGLLWVEPIRLSKQALSARLAKLPARLFARLFNEVLSQAQPLPAGNQDAPSAVADRFTAVWLADGSTLEALRRKLKELKDAKQPPLAGKMLMIVEGFTRRPVKAFYTDQAQANDKAFSDEVIQALPVGGLLVVDLGFFSFPFFDSLSDSKKYFVTRMRDKTSYEVVEVVASGEQFRDEVIRLGNTARTLAEPPCEW